MQRPEAPPVHLAAETVDEAEAWLSLLLCACVPTRWPGGADLLGRPVPLLASRVSEQSMASKTGPIPKLPRFKSSCVASLRASCAPPPPPPPSRCLVVVPAC